MPLPGRPARLLITARLSGAVGMPYLSVTMADGFGIGYQAQAGPLPADGLRHTLTVLVAPLPAPRTRCGSPVSACCTRCP